MMALYPFNNAVALPTGPALDLKKMLTGDVNRLRYITRYSTSLVLHRENVAEHSYYVALYSYLIAVWVQANYPVRAHTLQATEDALEVHFAKVLCRALLHDIDESRTGDFQRPFKYSRPELKALVDEAAKDEFERAVAPIIPGSLAFVRSMVHNWEHAKDDSTEGSIVAFADYLSVLSHLYAEVGCSNYTVMDHYISLKEYSCNFRESKYDFLRPLVLQSEVILNDLCIRAGVPIKE